MFPIPQSNILWQSNVNHRNTKLPIQSNTFWNSTNNNRNTTLPARTGQLWTIEEDKKLYELIQQNNNIPQLAMHHQRSEKAIKMRIIEKAINMINEKNIELQTALKLCRNLITEEDINKHNEYKEKRKEEKNKNHNGINEADIKRIADQLERIGNLLENFINKQN